MKWYEDLLPPLQMAKSRERVAEPPCRGEHGEQCCELTAELDAAPSLAQHLAKRVILIQKKAPGGACHPISQMGKLRG